MGKARIPSRQEMRIAVSETEMVNEFFRAKMLYGCQEDSIEEDIVDYYPYFYEAEMELVHLFSDDLDDDDPYNVGYYVPEYNHISSFF